jgi:hypothetical protein
MKAINNFITERLKVSSRSIDEISFEDLTFALYKYCNKHDVTELRLYTILDFKYKTIEQYPYFEKPMITKSGKEIKDIYGYITKIGVENNHKNGELTLIIYYVRTSNDFSPSICRIEHDRYDCITNWVKPEVLKEIYDYLINHA